MKKILFVCIFLLCSGCISSIDEKWAAVNEKARDANMAFALASESFIKGVNKMVINKHGLQQAHIQRDWDEFYIAKTDSNGKILAEDVRKRYNIAIADKDKLEKSKHEWELYKLKYLNAIEQLKRITISTRATEAEILAAKESAQAYLDSAMQILSGLGGIAIGTLLLP